MAFALYAKDLAAVLDWTIDWSTWLGTGETITASTWTVTPTGLPVETSTSTGTTATVWLGAGGTEGSTFLVTNRITTSAGRTDERSIQITTQQR